MTFSECQKIKRIKKNERKKYIMKKKLVAMLMVVIMLFSTNGFSIAADSVNTTQEVISVMDSEGYHL